MKLSIDPIADKCTSFISCKVIHNGHMLKISPTLKSVIVGIILFIFLMSIFSYAIYGGVRIAASTEHTIFGVGLYLVASLFIFGLLKLKLLSEKAFIINKNTSEYRLYNYWYPKIIYNSGSLSELNSVQVIEKTVDSHNSIRPVKFQCFEVNIGINDRTRINIMEHGNKNEILKDARLLARFLGVKLYEQNA